MSKILLHNFEVQFMAFVELLYLTKFKWKENSNETTKKKKRFSKTCKVQGIKIFSVESLRLQQLILKVVFFFGKKAADYLVFVWRELDVLYIGLSNRQESNRAFIVFQTCDTFQKNIYQCSHSIEMLLYYWQKKAVFSEKKILTLDLSRISWFSSLKNSFL